MKKIIFLAASAAIACAASAQHGQLHFLSSEGSTMVKSSELDKITYEGTDGEGFTHMNIAKTSGDPVRLSLDEISGCEMRGVGLPDTELSIAPAGSDAMVLLTSCRWKLADIGTNYGSDASYFWIPEYSVDDLISFSADNKVAIETGESNETYCDWKGAEEAHYIPAGTEGFHLGYNAEGQLCVDLFGGAFPLVRPNTPNEGIGGIYEVRELTESVCRLYISFGDGGYFYVALKNADVNPAAILTGKTWKLAELHYPADPWTLSIDDMPQSADERVTFNADGSCTITTDGTAYCNDEGVLAVTADGDETWEIVKNDNGQDCVKFGGGAFPCVLAATTDIDGTYVIEEISSRLCKLSIDYWGAPVIVTLVPAE